jgi:tetratricopeptide (TPR) repeat protein
MDLSENIEPVPALISPSPPRRRVRRWFLVLLGLAVLAVGGWFGGWHLWALHQLRAADKALERYEFSEALDEFEQCLRVWPHSIPTRLQAARAARRAGLLDRASNHLEVCEKTAVTPETALEQAMLLVQKGNLGEAVGLMNLVRQGHPDTALILESLTKGLITINRPQEALPLVSMLLQKNPDDAEGEFLLGVLSEMEGKTGKALSHYRRAHDLAPYPVRYQLGLADMLVEFGQASAAWPDYEELLRRSPEDPGVQLGSARCLRALGSSEAALEQLDTLLRDHPDHAEGWAERGRAWKDQGNSSEALRCLRRSFELEPRNGRIGFLLLTELRAQKKVAEAAALQEKVELLEREAKRLHDSPMQGKK